MSNRNEEIKKIRPDIKIEEKRNQTTIETFQNKCLRPVCKFQNDVLIEYISFYVLSKNKVYYKLSPKNRLNYIDSIFTKDSTFKHTLRGLIIGHFSQTEFQFYSTHYTEINKRIIQLIKIRFLSQR